jgi:hypothetical protein
MKRAFSLIVVPALLVALGFAQTPAASINTDQTVKGCLGGSDGNYTVVEDSTGHILKITTNSVDFKQHLGHDVALIGHRASGASSAAADNSFAVTELNMISEHCAAAAAPIATASTPSETASTPPASAAAPATTTSNIAENNIPPAAAAAPPAEAVVTPSAAAAPPAEAVVTPAAAAAPPAEIAVTPAATVSTPSETVSTHAPRPRTRSETPAAATTAPDVTASPSSETVSTPAAATTAPDVLASSSSETASTPAAAATPPAASSRGWSVSFLIAFAVLVIFLGTMVPVFSRWRKRKVLERTGAQNLSFTREASSDQGKSDQPGPRKAA